MRIVTVTISPEALRGIAEAATRLDEAHEGWGSLSLFYAARPPSDDDLERLAEAVQGADTVLFDLMGADQRWVDALGVLLVDFAGDLIPCGPTLSERARLGRFDMQAPRGDGSADEPAAARDARRFSEIVGAFRSMRGDDALFIVGTLLRDYGGRDDVQVPQPAGPPAGVQVSDPATRTRYDSLGAFIEANGGPGGRPVVALLHYGRSFPIDSEPIAAALAEALRPVCWVLPIAIDASAAESLEPLREILTAPGIGLELIVNLMSFQFGAGPMGGDPGAGVRLLNELGVPYVNPLILSRRTIDEWRESQAGLGASEVLVSLLLPELDGCLDEIPVAGMRPRPLLGDGDLMVDEPEVIPEQVERLVQRVEGLLRLRSLANEDKRVAIVGYDYPAGEGNMLGGAFIDAAASIEAIMADLLEHGYRVEPPEPGGLLPDLLNRAVNSPAYVTRRPAVTYSRERAERDLENPDAWDEVNGHWSEDTSLPMVDEQGDFQIPVVEYGNVVVGVQPGRAPMPAQGLTHDNLTPPHPQYLAFYTWLRKVWRADVIVHVGTHGTFEFLKAKENAVSTRCFPDLMLEGVPHVYLYYCANPTEGLIARRRSHACLVSYQPPVMRPGGLHDEPARLSALLDEYRRSLELAPQTAEDLLADLVRGAEEAHLPTGLDDLEAELERLKLGLVPLGLHTFGRIWDDEEVAEMVFGAVSHGLDDLPPAGELLAAADGITVPQFDQLDAGRRAHYDELAREFVAAALAQQDGEGVSEPLAFLAARCRELAGRFARNDEWDGLHAALEGRHVEARLGGDVIRSPEVMPSGASLYQFDPRQVPSPMALRRGVDIARQLRGAYQEAHDGHAPRCVGIVLWGIETSRTQGETYAEVMALLGVRMRERRRPGHRRFEVIPTEELEAPRVDVVVTISGFFRDMFGNLIEELDDMVKAVAELDEPAEINPVAARVREARERLRERGLSEADADELSVARVFGPAPGLYGTGLDAVIDAGRWETVEELAEHFMDAAQHVYGRGRHGERIDGLYREHLADVEAVSQIRSANEYQITDLDHFFEFLGGMTASASRVRGATVDTLVADTTGRRIHTATAAESTRAGLYTRLLNPLWIEAMLEHGHRGVAEIATRTTNLLGLSATTGQVEDWMFDAVFDRFVGDEEMRERLTQANPHATADLTARLTEAHSRGLWAAGERERALLEDVQFDIDSALEGVGETVDDNID